MRACAGSGLLIALALNSGSFNSINPAAITWVPVLLLTENDVAAERQGGTLDPSQHNQTVWPLRYQISQCKVCCRSRGCEDNPGRAAMPSSTHRAGPQRWTARTDMVQLSMFQSASSFLHRQTYATFHNVDVWRAMDLWFLLQCLMS